METTTGNTDNCTSGNNCTVNMDIQHKGSIMHNDVLLSAVKNKVVQ